MGCGGSTPVKADDTAKRSTPQQQQPQQQESPCLGLEDDYAFMHKLGQGEDASHAVCFFLLLALFLAAHLVSETLEESVMRFCRWHWAHILGGG